MGKTARGAVWLNAEQLSPYDYWQFWRNTRRWRCRPDSCKLFTDMPLDEIERLEALDGAAINEAKVALADAATAMLHGEEAAQAAEETARATFGGGGAGGDLPTLAVDGADRRSSRP